MACSMVLGENRFEGEPCIQDGHPGNHGGHPGSHGDHPYCDTHDQLSLTTA
jgi:hypothetical protein